MYAVIDTNVFYRLAKIRAEEPFSVERIRSELERYTGVIVTELTLMELYTRFGSQKRKIRKALRFLVHDPLIEFRYHSPFGYPRMKKIKAMLKNTKGFEYVIDYAELYGKKTHLEFKHCSTLIESLLYAISEAAILRNPVPLDESRKSVFRFQVSQEVLVFRDSLGPRLSEILNEFYQRRHKTSWFKDQADRLLLPTLYLLARIFCHICLDLPWSDIPTLQQEEGIKRCIMESPITRAIVERMDNPEIHLLDKVEPEIKATWDLYRDFMLKTGLQPGKVHYNIALMGRMMTTPRKIAKNDFIDSELMVYYHEYQILTFDKPLRSFMSEFDPGYAKRIEDFYSACLK